MTLKVAVIGAGAAGLCALRHLMAKSVEFQAVCFEQNTRVGGTWIYTDNIGTDENGLPVHSSMYKQLKTNLPKEVMAFPDFPFRTDLPSFIKHEDVLEYLEDYAKNFNLLDNIKFETVVEKVNPLANNNNLSDGSSNNVSNGKHWELMYRHAKEKDMKTDFFDAVVVCNGHYSIPLMPDIPGQEKFKGQVRHSHTYRYPSEFSDMRVVCLGAAASGQDISVDISSAAKQVYLSHNKPALKTYLPDNLQQKPGISELTENTVIFKDGTEEEIDAILFCTGYKYTFPFLTEECHLKIQDEVVSPLYHHIIHTEYPTLGFIGILKTICPFPNFHNQVLFFLASLTGQMNLPSEDDMNKSWKEEFDWRTQELKYPIRYAHTMGKLQWAYNDKLADKAGFDRIPKVVERLYDHVHATRVLDIVHYKTLNYKLVDDQKFQECES